VAAVATLVGAGDIGVCGRSEPEATARLLDGIPGTVFTTGDNPYPSGTEQQFRDCYEPTWGRHRRRTRPAPGNHDYESPGASPYFAYFGANAGPPGLGYYSYRLGEWDVYSLNSNIVADERSAQYAWLQQELQQHASRCSLAYWHHPVVSEGPNGDAGHMRAIWKLLHDHGADLVVAGHDHNYQRFVPLDGDLRRSPATGMRQFVVGTGGASHYSFAATGATVVRGAAWGVLKLTLAPDKYDWEFVAVPGQGFHDAGTAQCR
jgi:hypothetical protein